jgi:hypothetical protein
MKPISRGVNISGNYSIKRLGSRKGYGTPGKESKYLDDVRMFVIFKYYRGEKTMKLNLKLHLLFIIMDLLTLLAYPLVFVYGTLHQFLKPKGTASLANLLVTAPVASGR